MEARISLWGSESKEDLSSKIFWSIVRVNLETTSMYRKGVGKSSEKDQQEHASSHEIWRHRTWKKRKNINVINIDLRKKPIKRNV